MDLMSLVCVPAMMVTSGGGGFGGLNGAYDNVNAINN